MLGIYELVENLGIKSKPILKFYLNNNLIKDNIQECFINGIIEYWDGNIDKSIKILLKNDFTNEQYSILSCMLLFEMYIIKRDEKNIKLMYDNLKNTVYTISSSKIRNKINLELAWYETIELKNYTKIDSIKFDMKNDILRSYYYYYKSKVEFYANKNYGTGLNYLNLAYDCIKNKKRASTEIIILNSLTYQTWRYDTKIKAKRKAEELCTKIGYWLDIEEYKINLFCLDTIIEIDPDARYLELFSNIYDSIQDLNYINVVEKIKNRTDETFKKNIEDYRKQCDYYKNQDIKVSLDVYMSHLRNYSWNDYLEGELKARTLLPRSTSYIEKTRLELIKKFLAKFNKKIIQIFEKLYFDSVEETRTLIDKFCINYIRYHEYENYIHEFKFSGIDLGLEKLNKKISEVVLYLFSEEERVEVVNFFKDFSGRL